jgi:hypothetical protein
MPGVRCSDVVKVEGKKMHPSQVIKEVCDLLLAGDKKQAGDIVRAHYPFKPSTYEELSSPLITPQIKEAKKLAKLNPLPKIVAPDKRKWGTLGYTKLFIRDGFIDRYSGKRIVFPGTLRLLSLLMPEELPEHPNWALKHGHVMYWELLPTLDHIIPLAKGGRDVEANWVSTSWLNNFIKLDFTLEEIGWSLYPEGRFEEWDGLLHWFNVFMGRNPEYLSHSFLNSWHIAANRCLVELAKDANRT